VLNGLDLELSPGESLAILGSSGSGKSTLLRIIAGLEVPERGEVSLDGRPATRDGRLLIPPHRRQVAMLFQDLALWPNLTVAGNVQLGLSGLRLPRAEARTRVAHSLQLCDISELADRVPGTLSGGQQQRVALARALAMRPRLMLLDEPFGGLDLLTKQLIVQEIGRLRSELGVSLLLVTHDPAEVRQLCRSLAVVDQGRVMECGPLQDIAIAPRTPLAQAMAPRLRGLA
jgi:ABC-type sulfate/molybdate transport systems ATPase subunit